MKILVINCGSSSLKYQLIDMDGEKVLCKGLCERIGMESSMITHEANGTKATTPAIFPTHTEAFAEVVKKMTTGAGKCINDVSEIDAIGHRVVHGGEKFKSSCLITDEVIETLRELSPLAPLHNPAGILGIEAARKVFGNIPMVAVFDTAFHSTMPPKAYMYAIPYEYYEKYGVRRYGFHGTSHKYVAHKAAEYLEEQLQSLIGKGYLQNLRIDLENRTVGLYIPEGALVQWVCTSCGAKNLARRGGPMRCRYCDQPRGQ